MELPNTPDFWRLRDPLFGEEAEQQLEVVDPAKLYPVGGERTCEVLSQGGALYSGGRPGTHPQGQGLVVTAWGGC